MIDATVNRRTLQRWRSQGAPERGSRALDAVDAAARTQLPGYPPAGHPGGGLPALVGERPGEDLTSADAPGGPDPASAVVTSHGVRPADDPDTAPRVRHRPSLSWALVALLAVGLVVMTLLLVRTARDDAATRARIGTTDLAPPGSVLALVDLTGLDEDTDQWIGSYTQPAVQRNCDGVICPGSPRRISNHFHGDPVFVECHIAAEFVEVGPPGEPGWYGGTDWLKLVTADGDRWISNTWVLRDELREAGIPVCP